MARVQNTAARRSNATSDNSSCSSGSTYDSGGGWNVFNWFSGGGSDYTTVSAEVDLCR
jgi:hypothetical protein